MSLAPHARAHLGRVIWIVRDALGSAKRRVLLAATLDLAGFSAAAGLLGGIYVYAKRLEAGGPLPRVPLLHLTAPSPGDGPAFAAWAAVSVLVAAVAAGCVYRAQWVAAAAATTYQRRCIQRVLQLAATLRIEWSQVFVGDPERALARLCAAPAKQLSLVVRSLVQAVLPVAQLCGALGIMFWREPVLTLLLLPLVGLYLIPMVRVNRRVAADQRELAIVGRDAHALVKGALDQALDGDVADERAAEWADGVAQSELQQRNGMLFYRRRLADNLMQFVNSIAFVLGLLTVLVFHVFAVGDGTHTWSSMVLYLVAVKLAQGGVKHLTGIIVRISRLTPEFKPYVEFMQGIEASQARGPDAQGRLHWKSAPLLVGAVVRVDDDDDDLDDDD